MPDELRSDARTARRRLAVRRERHAPARRTPSRPATWPGVGGVVGGCRRADDADARPAGDSRAARAAQTAVITPRTTRLVRVADLSAFRAALASLACEGPALDARDRLVVVPTRAAAAQLAAASRTAGSPAGRTLVLPDFVPVGELVTALAGAARATPPVLLGGRTRGAAGVACRAARGRRARAAVPAAPGLVAEILRFYDTLRRNQKDVDTFERLALGMLEPGAAVRPRRRAAGPADALPRRRVSRRSRNALPRARRRRARRRAERLLATAAAASVAPRRRGGGRSRLRSARAGAGRLGSAVARPGLERLDVVVTDTRARRRVSRAHPPAAARASRRCAFDGEPRSAPALLVPARRRVVHVARDREEEVAGFARRVKAAVRSGRAAALDRTALVVHQPLPYVYLAREVLRSAGMPCQMFDALPLAAEPYAAALDLVLRVVSTNFARGPAVALLRSPHFGSRRRRSRDVAALDRALASSGYLGDLAALGAPGRRLGAGGRQRSGCARGARRPRAARARRASWRRCGRRRRAPSTSTACWRSCAPTSALPGRDDPLRARQLRARAAVLATLTALRDAYRALRRRRRWSSTTSRRARAPLDRGADVRAAHRRARRAHGRRRERPVRRFRRTCSSPASWTASGRSRRAATSSIRRRCCASSAGRRSPSASTARARRLPTCCGCRVAPGRVRRSRSKTTRWSRRRRWSTSSDAAGLDRSRSRCRHVRIFDYEALASSRSTLDALAGDRVRAWAAAPARGARPATRASRAHRRARRRGRYSLSALERYQDCPFKFFAADVLRLEEPPEDEAALSPRARGRFIHEVFQRFFEAWDARGAGTITPERAGRGARAVRRGRRAAARAAARADAALERARLFGSAISVGIVDVVLGARGVAAGDVRERWLEYRFDGEFALGRADGRRCALQGRGRPHRSARRATACASSTTSPATRRTPSARCRCPSTRCARRSGWRARRRGRGRSTRRRTSRSPASARSCRSSSAGRRRRRDVLGERARARARRRRRHRPRRVSAAAARPDDVPLLRLLVGLPQGLRRR